MRYHALLLLFFSVALKAETVVGTATLIDLQGQVEFRTGLTAWQTARRNQDLTPGQSLRTGKGAKAALLLSDRTQVRLHENTLIEVQAIGAAPRSAGQTKFRQSAGRAWVQSKTPPKSLEWHTPTSVAGVRGTDWEMAVNEAGQSTLSVFSGQIEFGNEQGRLAVSANEQAQAESGKAPAKLAVRNLKDRIQWVTAYRMAPWRFVSLTGDSLPNLRQRLETSTDTVERGRILADLGRWTEAEQAFSSSNTAAASIGLAWCTLRQGDQAAALDWLTKVESMRDSEIWRLADAARQIGQGEIDGARSTLLQLIEQGQPSQAAPWLMLSDIDAFLGRLDDALAVLQSGLQRFPQSAPLLARQAEIHLLADRLPEAMAAADSAIEADLGSHESWLIRAEIARRHGDAATTLAAYELALALKPADDRAWFGRGSALAEREYVELARADLTQGLRIDPNGPGYQGELGTLESQAAEYDAADRAYRAALASNPADYVALTGLGVLELKRGHPQAALEHLLKAGVMEPRFARAHVYSAVAYWQLGDRKQAREELTRAGELDDKDPLPHFMAAMMSADQLMPGDAVESARAALTRLPYLKSLNQLASDQQGSANLGQAFAFMGLEDWARAYAQDSYSPFWAGSHLFLADRYNGLFSKNSELFQGLIADPTVFGAGIRFQSLVQAPATNLDLSLRYTGSDQLDGLSPQVQFSGYRAEPRPLAWFVAQESVDWRFHDRPFDLDVLTAAFGIKPRHDLGLFVFADRSRQDSQPAGTLGIYDHDVSDRLDTHRLDIGFGYKASPVSQFWLKAGRFDSDERIAGALTGLFANPITADTKVELPELALSHSFQTAGDHLIRWGIDHARRNTLGHFDINGFFPELHDYAIKEQSTDVYLSDSFAVAQTPGQRLTAQIDLWLQKHTRSALDQPYFFVPDPFNLGTPTVESEEAEQISPRLGLVYRPDENTRLRLAWQNWRRPAGMSSLGPVATAGIPLDDRLVMRGGELHRLRLQADWEATPSTFLSSHIDYKDIDNRRFSIRPFAVNELESLGKLRPRDYGQLMRDDLYEFVDAPDYAGGIVRQAGLSLNQMLGRQWGVMGRYLYTDSENMGNAALKVPYLARHSLAIGATWIRPDGWYIAGRLSHLGQRYADEANSQSLSGSLSGDLDLFWQSPDKNWLLRLSANDLLDEKSASQYTAELNYRF